MGLIRDNDETAYRDEVQHLSTWCHDNNLTLNTQKTKEIIMDLRRSRSQAHPPVYISGAAVEQVTSFKSLATHISSDLTWSLNFSVLVQKAQRLYFLQSLKKVHLSPRILVNFYRCTIESILTNGISVWPSKTTPLPGQLLARNSDCPNGWVLFNGRCFRHFSGSLDWSSAEQYCVVEGGHLVSIHSDSENQLVKALIRSIEGRDAPTWIGLSDCQQRNTWIWTDGSGYVYSKWNNDEPNHSQGECCVHINWGNEKNWNDDPCRHTYPFVCAKRKL
ncbi:hypothetical protein NFI96_011076 [Prochilodus magdalenae]|nr:hypothetical protein NFI96_011076 [Prochilodus magdalenae]